MGWMLFLPPNQERQSTEGHKAQKVKELKVTASSCENMTSSTKPEIKRIAFIEPPYISQVLEG